MSLVVACCGNFEPEVRLVLEGSDFRGEDAVALLTFPATCGRPPLTAESLRGVRGSTVEGRIDVFGEACCAGLASRADCTVHRLGQCFYLVAPPALVDHHLAAGAYLVTPGWLAHWRARLDHLGIDAATAPAMFAESMRRVVLLDTGADPGSAESLAAFGAFVGLPTETVPVGLDYLRVNLSRLVARRRLEAERTESLAAISGAHRQSAQHAAALDLLSNLTEITVEREAIQRALDVFVMLFAPKQATFVSVQDGAPTYAVSRPPREGDARALLSRLEENGGDHLVGATGFVLPIRHARGLLGVVEVEGIAAPDHLDRDLGLALTIAGVCGLAISNARKYEEIKQAEEALAVEREHLAVTLQSIGDAVIATDTEGRVTTLNRVAESLTGCTQAEARGKPLGEVFRIVHEKTGSPAPDPVREVLESGVAVGPKNHTAVIARDGTRLSVADGAAPIRDQSGELRGVVLVFRDVSEARDVEQEREIAIEFLGLVNASSSTSDLIRAATAFFQEQSGCEAVGIRLKQGEDFPYYEARGFPKEFLRLENHICARDEVGNLRRDSAGNPVMECMCGNVLCGSANPQKTFFTAGGSFWANSTTRLLATTSDEDRQARTRNRCNGEGYESVALMPLRVGQERLGLLQLNDRRKGMFTPEAIARWERLAGYLAVAVAKARAEESMRESEARLRLLSGTAGQLLAIEDPQTHVNELCREVMEHLGCEAFFNFLVDESAGRLRLNACAGIPGEEVRKLEWLDYGAAVSGCVARDKQRVIAEDILHSSDCRTELIKSYGIQAYCCHPLMVQGRLLGTLSFGTRTRARFTSDDVETMRAVADQVATAMERMQGQRALRAANAKLVEADRLKNEFLAMLSHELRNPLAPILNSVYILERAVPGGEQATRAREVIQRQSVHMTRLIDDLLDVTRVSRGKIRLQRGRVDLGRIVRGTAEDQREIFLSNGIELHVSVVSEPLFVDGDPTRIAQMIGNLLQNAAKFTHKGGHTYLSLAPGDDGQALVQVRDDGAGIQPELLARLFEPFVQADRTLDRSRGGLGLGLALVKGLVELHGGTVSAKSEGPGKGAVFTLRLPLGAPAKHPPAHRPAEQAPSSLRRVLVIEDNADAAQSLKEVLELGGHVVEVALHGQTGIERSRTFLPDIIVCDIGLPGLDGYSVAEAIRADPALRTIRLVALTGYAGPDDIERSRAAGFDHHLAKPPDMAQLETVLADCAARTAVT
jgi:PAS domain S-box-containing protein